MKPASHSPFLARFPPCFPTRCPIVPTGAAGVIAPQWKITLRLRWRGSLKRVRDAANAAFRERLNPQNSRIFLPHAKPRWVQPKRGPDPAGCAHKNRVERQPRARSAAGSMPNPRDDSHGGERVVSAALGTLIAAHPHAGFRAQLCVVARSGAGCRRTLIHMLEADPQVIPAGDQRQHRRAPQGRDADLVNPVLQRRRARQDQRAQRHQLQRGLPLGEL